MDNLVTIVLFGPVKRREVSLVLLVDVGSVGEQELAQILLAFAGTVEERGLTVAVFGVDVGAQGDELSSDVTVSFPALWDWEVPSSVVEWRLSVVVFVADIAACMYVRVHEYRGPRRDPRSPPCLRVPHSKARSG